MKMSPAYESRVCEALAAVRSAAERADQARDTDAMIQALAAVRDATIKAAFVVREADDAMRAEAHKSKEIAA
jgi:hypothetical protein